MLGSQNQIAANASNFFAGTAAVAASLCEALPLIQPHTPRLVAQRATATIASSTFQRIPKVFDRLLDSLLELNSRLPTQDFFRTSDVWLAHLRVIHRQWFVVDRRFRP